MLKHLSIRNFVLIKELDIDFSNGYSAITGETGAGKSIFLGALSLLLGNRADVSVISDKENKCIIEGEFIIDGIIDRDFFIINEIDYDETCLVRREINSQGRSRAFVNDTPVPINVLKELGEKLIDIHSQHSTILLSQNSFHLKLLDAVANTTEEFKAYSKSWNDYKKLKNELSILKNELNEKELEQDYFNFLLQEIKDINPQLGEKEILEQEVDVLRNAEKIKAMLFESANNFKFEDHNILSVLQKSHNNLISISNFFPKVAPLVQRIESLIIELDDISVELNQLNESVQIDPERNIIIEERLNSVNNLLYKHKLSDISDLLELQNGFSEKLEQIDEIRDSIKLKEKELSLIEQKLTKQASFISEKRREVTPMLETKIVEILKDLGMPNARFKVKQNVSDFLSSNGFDEVGFYFSANKGEEIAELSKVASGGEMSRLMLALKYIVASVSQLPTLIFDEIDTGISGEIAKKMSAIFTQMGKSIQLIVITHLPQIAARATHHYSVLKVENKDNTVSKMIKLNEEVRIIEIAKMLGGNNYSESAHKTALELMKNT